MRITHVGITGLLGLLVAVGCGGGGGPGTDDPDAGAEPVALAFVTPTAGARVERDQVEPTEGWRAARVDVEVAVTGDGVASIDLSAGGMALGTFDEAHRAEALLVAPGLTTLTATARDAGGATLAQATVDVEVGEPTTASCKAWLDRFGVAYTVGPASMGVSDPVTLRLPINGMPFRYLGNASRRTTFFMDCSLARSLFDAAPFLRSRGVTEVVDLGVYNYRCIGTGTPPNCPQGMSQHAYAKAIDLHEFRTADGTAYNVETDWVIDPTAERTCEAATSNDEDAWLHEVICAIKADDVWNIVLTPNYNAAHRNHFHVDLTADSDFIRRLAPTAVLGMDEGPDDW